MRRYEDVVENQAGTPISGATVDVFLEDTETSATIYSDAGTTSKANPLTTDSLGRFWFYIADGIYDLRVSGTGIPTPYTQESVEIADVTGTPEDSDADLQARVVNAVRFANGFEGANAGAKISAAITDLPSTGGTVDALGLEGSQTIATDIFTGVTKQVTLLIGAATIAFSASTTIPSNVTLKIYPGASLQPAASTTLTINGPIFSYTSSFTGGSGTVVFGGGACYPESASDWIIKRDSANSNIGLKLQNDAQSWNIAVRGADSLADQLIIRDVTNSRDVLVLEKGTWASGLGVGIGTSSPEAALHIANTVGNDIKLSQSLAEGEAFSLSIAPNTISFARAAGDSYLDKVDANDLYVRLGDPVVARLRLANAGHIIPNVTATQDLGSSTKTWADIYTKRIRSSGGTTLVAGDFALSSGWGTTASIGTITGSDQRFRATITSAGTGQGASPTVVLTFKDGTWSTVPFFVVSRAGGSQATVQFEVTTVTATALTLTFQGTPSATETYVFTCVGLG